MCFCCPFLQPWSVLWRLYKTRSVIWSWRGQVLPGSFVTWLRRPSVIQGLPRPRWPLFLPTLPPLLMLLLHRMKVGSWLLAHSVYEVEQNVINLDPPSTDTLYRKRYKYSMDVGGLASQTIYMYIGEVYKCMPPTLNFPFPLSYNCIHT